MKSPDEMRQTFFNKVNRKYLADSSPTWELNGIEIVPSISLELIVNHGIAQNKLYLALGHAGFQPINHLLGDNVSLLNGNSVYAREPECRAGC